MKVSAEQNERFFVTISPNGQGLPHKGLDHGFSVTITDTVRGCEHRRQARASGSFIRTRRARFGRILRRTRNELPIAAQWPPIDPRGSGRGSGR
ncbi:hypothetical protein [Brevundimonas sp.]|uniref:hypothetical protein n=1 Tax=Brevundimonas sp. TaxID=1871086 RepID=UPI002AC9657F|nr:hypothetical protein [Brevundimonas sp.]